MRSTELLATTVLPAHQWVACADEHRRRIRTYTDPLRQVHRRGIKHPVYDFMFSYYYQSMGAMERWHPGAGVILAHHPDAPGDRADVTDYRGYWESQKYYRFVEPDAQAGLPHGGWTVDMSAFMAARESMVEFALRLLPATEARPARLSCFGLHEWAMAYRSDIHGIRHSTVPLRLGSQGTDDVVENHKITCTHFDAFRFYSPEATAFNTFQPQRDTMVEMEQPGCLHANMDLYKWAFKLLPALSSDLIADCFELAWDIRTMDMQASPYDLADWGFEPIRIETAEGKTAYVQAQREFSERAQTLRRRIIDAVNTLTHIPHDGPAR